MSRMLNQTYGTSFCGEILYIVVKLLLLSVLLHFLSENLYRF